MSRSVLICDDDEDILEVTKLILTMKNYTVHTLSDSNNLIEKVEKINPAIILMDLNIPETGGEKATGDLKKNFATQHIPVLIFSANPEISNIAIRAGADGFLSKPFDINTLEATINKFISIKEV